MSAQLIDDSIYMLYRQRLKMTHIFKKMNLSDGKTVDLETWEEKGNRGLHTSLYLPQ